MLVNVLLIHGPPLLAVWGYGFLMVTIINGCALLGFAFTPFIGRHYYKLIMTFMVALAVGSLCGSAILFLFPDVSSVFRVFLMCYYVYPACTVPIFLSLNFFFIYAWNLIIINKHIWTTLTQELIKQKNIFTIIKLIFFWRLQSISKKSVTTKSSASAQASFWKAESVKTSSSSFFYIFDQLMNR